MLISCSKALWSAQIVTSVAAPKAEGHSQYSTMTFFQNYEVAIMNIFHISQIALGTTQDYLGSSASARSHPVSGLC